MQAVSLSLTPQRVPVIIPPLLPPALPKKLLPPQHRPSLLSTYRAISPHFQIRPPPQFQLAQSIQHDPTVAGKMFHPVTGRLETIDALLKGPDSTRWTISFTNE